jgi:5,5'-dehydrodivanillate O-demethylase
MLSQAENERLTQVGPGTPMGELMRRYWQPIAMLPDLDREEVLPLRVLGEDLALFRTTTGKLGLVQARCPHRSVSLAYGIPEVDGIRCAYHGWYFTPAGECIHQPYDEAENPESSFKDRVKVTSYPVQAMAGMVWAYLGPAPAPVLPRFENLAREDLSRSIQWTLLPCNWLQVMENSMDPAHFEWLHANRMNYTARKRGLPPVMRPGKTQQLAFDVFEFGIQKRRVVEGDPPEESPDWLVGHPTLFPNALANGMRFQFRVPVDDEHTLNIMHTSRELKPGEAPTVDARCLDWADDEGRFILDTIMGTDMMAWVTQGPVMPRHLEHLGLVDQGVILYRRLLEENMAKVQRGVDPMGLIRDPGRGLVHIVTEADVGGGWRAFRAPAIAAG